MPSGSGIALQSDRRNLGYVYLFSDDHMGRFLYLCFERSDINFFVVPRGAIDKETAVCSSTNWIFEYQDAWHLLTEELSPDKLERRFRILNSKTGGVIAAAEKKGCQVDLIRKKGRHFPFYRQNKLVINGRRCQVMSASRLSKDQNLYHSMVVNLNPPRDKWAEFLIFVIPQADGRSPIFIVPRDRVPHKTTATLTAGWFLDFLDAWSLIASSLPSRPDSSEGTSA